MLERVRKAGEAAGRDGYPKQANPFRALDIRAAWAAGWRVGNQIRCMPEAARRARERTS